MNKSELRRQIRGLKASYTTEQLHSMSLVVCEQVLALPQWHSAQTVLLYSSLSDEVDTSLLISTAMQQGKQVLLPSLLSSHSLHGEDMELRIFTGVQSMQMGPFGILEPVGEVFPAERYADIQLAVIPGMAFDDENHRLGRGKGYYDKFLPGLPSAYKVGICFPFQHLPSIPSEPHDVLMDMIV